MALINLKNCIIELRDGSNKKLVLKIGGGNITYSEKKNMEYVMDRGNIDTVREGADVPMDVKFEIQWTHLTAMNTDTVPTPEDALKKRGGAQSWVSSSADLCEPYAVDIYIFDIPTCNAEDPETIILPDFRYESLDHDPKTGVLSCSGKSNAKEATPTRGAVST